MGEFTELLRETLKGVSEEFQQAKADLNEVIESLSQSVEEVTQGEGMVRMVPTKESFGWVIYTIELVFNNAERFQESTTTLTHVRISAEGYPLGVTPNADFNADFLVPKEGFDLGPLYLADKEQVKAFFREMVTNPDSPLIQGIRFHSRQQEQ